MRDRNLLIASYVLALVGLGCAIFLTYTKLADDGVCGISGGCTIVQQSRWSTIGGIPVSIFGIAGYVATLALLSLRGETVRLLTVMVTGVGFLFSLYLMYRAYVTLDAFCPFCTGSAVMMTLLFLINTVRFVLGPDQPAYVGAALDEDEPAERPA